LRRRWRTGIEDDGQDEGKESVRVQGSDGLEISVKGFGFRVSGVAALALTGVNPESPNPESRDFGL